MSMLYNYLKNHYIKLLSPITKRQEQSICALNRICDELQQMKSAWNHAESRLISSGSPDLNEIEVCKAETVENCAKNDKLCITVPEILGKKYFWVSDATATDNVSERAHEGLPWFPSELFCFAEKGSGCFLDLGANIGGVSLALEACGWNGFAVEASEINCKLLEKSIFLNDADIVLCKMGVWKYTGSIYFLQAGPWGAILENGENREKAEKIDVLCLDDYERTNLCCIQSLDLIKMDIEGSEVAALEGMGNFLKQMDYPYIFAEANALALSNTASNTVGDMIQKGAEYGYETYRFVNGIWMKYDESYFMDTICTDFMFIHKDKKTAFPGKIGGDYPRPDHKQTVEYIISVLNEFILDPQAQGSFELCVYVLATLRDFPQFVQVERVMELLRKIDICTDLPEAIRKPLKKLLGICAVV